jgi:hypothetical protein
MKLKESPAAFVEWQQAVQSYVDARESGKSLKPALARVRKAWLAIKDERGFEPSPFAVELMAEVIRPLQ